MSKNNTSGDSIQERALYPKDSVCTMQLLSDIPGSPSGPISPCGPVGPVSPVGPVGHWVADDWPPPLVSAVVAIVYVGSFSSAITSAAGTKESSPPSVTAS